MYLRSIVWFLMVFAAVACSASAEPTFKVYLETSGVYRVTYERLRESGLPEASWNATEIAVHNRGKEVAHWVEDGGDGIFGPGDWLEIVGEQAHGEATYLDEYSKFNCYFVSFGEQGKPGLVEGVTARSSAEAGTPLEGRYHFERDVLMLRFKEKPGSSMEQWYWTRINVMDKEPFAFDFKTPGRSSGEGELRFRFAFRGWSKPRGVGGDTFVDHRIEMTLNDTGIGSSEWNGTDHHVVEIAAPLNLLIEGSNRLEFRVPKRMFEETQDLIVDVVMLNSIEIAYPFDLSVGDHQARFFAEGAETEAGFVFDNADNRSFRIYTNDGRRFDVETSANSGRVDIDVPESGLWVVRREELHDPDVVVADQPSHLRHRKESVDYIMIAHRSLISSLEPLVDMHRRRGLHVEVVDVQDVFDEFNFGIVHPRAIRDFLDAAFHGWPQPAPRYVLLVGDASWDYKNSQADDENYSDWGFMPGETRRFVKNAMTTYTENSELNNRNLVPTWDYPSHYGHAASDNWFVCLDGDDAIPEMAIGRFPFVTNEELEGVVAKTITYVEKSEVGPWRRNMLFISNDSLSFQRQTDRIADQVAKLGFVPVKVYPKGSEPANELHSQRLIELFDDGLQMVLFYGHGGRYIWRTGPPDLKKNHDLFTLDHLDQLKPTTRLSVVLSLTCYSAPFDHPSADSIGEKLLRMKDKGAIGVFAASWRNSPSTTMGQKFVEGLEGGATIGEAILRMKKRLNNVVLLQTYNLLGDPAVPLAMPKYAIQMAVKTDGEGIVVSGEIDADEFSGELMIDLMGDNDTVLKSMRLLIDDVSFEVAFSGEDDVLDCVGARTYAWNEENGTDAIGWVEFVKNEDLREEEGT